MFLSRLLLEAHDEPMLWTVRAPLHWCCDRFGNRVVREGFVTDLASIPMLVQAVPGYHPNGRTRRGAVLHDHEYSRQVITKAEADLLFYRALLADRVEHHVALACYNAVSMFGGGRWSEAAAKLRGPQ